MKIIKYKSNNIVIYAGEDLELTEIGLKNKDLFSPIITTENSIIEEVNNIPNDFKGNHYKYEDNTWIKTNIGSIATDKLLQELKENKKEKINNLRELKIQEGFSYVFPDGKTGNIQLRDDKDIRNIQGVATTGILFVVQNNTTDKISFKDEENIEHFMTGQEAALFGLQVSLFISNTYQKSWIHKENIDNLTTINEIESYNIHNGWD